MIFGCLISFHEIFLSELENVIFIFSILTHTNSVFAFFELYVHKLVASTYCEIPESIENDNLAIEHVDGDHKNNYFENLVWISGVEKAKSKIVMQRDLESGDVIQVFRSLKSRHKKPIDKSSKAQSKRM